MNQYFSTFIVGLGEVIQNQLDKALDDFEVDLLLDGLIVYRSSAPWEKIKSLRFLNNSFLCLSEFKGKLNGPMVYMTERVLREPLPQIKLGKKSFRVIFSLANEPVAVNKDLLAKLEQKISLQYKVEVDRTSPEMEFWFLYRSEGYGFFGLRLTRHPDYKKILQKGQLRPELANLLCLLSEPKAEDVILDPFAGSGAIPLERANFPYKQIYAGEIEEQLVKAIQEKTKGKKILLLQLDATDLKDFASASIDKIITDPPWGVSVGKDIDIAKLYERMFKEFARVVKPGGLVILLVGNKELFESILKCYFSEFSLLIKYDLLVSGKKAAIYKLKRL